jgi:hypothetical protein
MGTTRESLPVGWRQVTCPTCGSELRYGEMIFSCRPLDGWDDGTLYISQCYEDFAEANDDEHLYCTGCSKEWTLPDDVCFDGLKDFP